MVIFVWNHIIYCIILDQLLYATSRVISETCYHFSVKHLLWHQMKLRSWSTTIKIHYVIKVALSTLKLFFTGLCLVMVFRHPEILFRQCLFKMLATSSISTNIIRVLKGLSCPCSFFWTGIFSRVPCFYKK